MKEVKNIQLEWGHILMKQMQAFDQISDQNLSKSLYASLIEKLNSNQVPSKVYFKDGVPKCYGYLLPSADSSDRILCSIGFESEDETLIEMGKKILEWFIEVGKSHEKLIILDGVFNGAFFEETVQQYGFLVANRVKLVCDLETIIENLSEKVEHVHSHGLLLNLDEVDIGELCIAEENAYIDSPDKFLLIRNEGKNVTLQVILQGIYGKPLKAVSSVIYGSSVEGMIVVTDGTVEIFHTSTPLIVDIFVAPEYKRKGIGSTLMLYAARKLKILGHNQVQLWVNTDSQAYNFYKSIGFSYEGEDDRLWYLDFRRLYHRNRINSV